MARIASRAYAPGAYDARDERADERRDASHHGSVDHASAQVTWGELGCPTHTGEYPLGRELIRVKHIHIVVAENDPAARFTVVAFRPPLGPAEFVLGHRVD
jgi:hypothetical protein